MIAEASAVEGREAAIQDVVHVALTTCTAEDIADLCESDQEFINTMDAEVARLIREHGNNRLRAAYIQAVERATSATYDRLSTKS